MPEPVNLARARWTHPVSVSRRDRTCPTSHHTGSVITEPAPSLHAGSPSGRAKRLAVFVTLVLVLTVSAGLWWANSQGYVPDLRQGCTDEGYPVPMPSFDELVNDYGKDPYCARRARGEAWF